MKKRFYNKRLIHRSLLFVAGHNDKYIEKSFTTKADAIVFDFEDAVPKNKKNIARQKINHLLNNNLSDDRPIYVRINPLQSGMTLLDLDAVALPNLNGFIYPMVKTEKDIEAFDAQLLLKEKTLRLNEGHFKIIILIETPEAVLNCFLIAKSSQRTIALLFGSEDFLAQTESYHGKNNATLFVPRHTISMAAKAINIMAIDTPYVDFTNPDGLGTHIKQAIPLGFEGMLTMSPKQIPIIHDLYTYNDEEVTKAREIVRLTEEAQASNRGIAVSDGHFISPPTLDRARRTLDRHQATLEYVRFFHLE